MLACYFDYIFVHLRQKVLFRPDLSPKFLWTLGTNPTEKPSPTYNSASESLQKIAATCAMTFVFFLGGGSQTDSKILKNCGWAKLWEMDHAKFSKWKWASVRKGFGNSALLFLFVDIILSTGILTKIKRQSLTTETIWKFDILAV